ncbi:class I SAM-dependent methyltransferase [uncultured Jannaschia sp.]|uniref:class I SAM-dependent methyltransferase n=1 Tax=uncultured Jannaschia sp. TaxID=293347 RepID=UPI0026165589|nr:class I SAM-dependent methyltransferase [uncultured Jannaschia sp.]
MKQSWAAYEGDSGRDLARTYEALDPDRLNAWLRDLLPAPPGAVLDVGAGSGRDAAWLACLGHEVVAVEPSATMRAEAQARHEEDRIVWVDDHLPALDRVLRLGCAFDLILVSAIWMHVPPEDRARAFRKLVTLLKPGGVIAMVLRSGPSPAGRAMHPVSTAEVAQLAHRHGAAVVLEDAEGAPDAMGRADVIWHRIALRLPDDGTGALPLLRHVILNDTKSSTYKLGLLRAVLRAADGAQGTVQTVGDDRVRIPLGLVALNWVRLYLPLVREQLPQRPGNAGPEGLGFVSPAWARLDDLAPFELRPGMTFTGPRARALHAALRDASRTIARMPATFMTWPGSDTPIMPARLARMRAAGARLSLDAATLQGFGTLEMPLHLWRALSRFAAWIEPALVAEWQRLMDGYACRSSRTLDPARLSRAMVWDDPDRDTRLVREIVLSAFAAGPVHCVWSGRRLTPDRLDIDHCLPWSAWACNDLWNLMPCDARVNRSRKRDRLPSAGLLVARADAIQSWWQVGYVQPGTVSADRFYAEAATSLPLARADPPDIGEVFRGLQAKRLMIRTDTQIAEWKG